MNEFILPKSARKMLYECLVTVKSDNPTWSFHDCLEQAFLKCAGLSNYYAPLQTIIPEYNEWKNKLESKEEAGEVKSAHTRSPE